jgi:hypothetical protein
VQHVRAFPKLLDSRAVPLEFGCQLAKNPLEDLQFVALCNKACTMLSRWFFIRLAFFFTGGGAAAVAAVQYPFS